MRKFLQKLIGDENGNTLILAGLSLTCVLTLAGFAIDGSLVYMTKTKLQKAANAAVLSGAQELTNNEQKVNNVVNDILSAHNESKSLEKLDIKLGEKVSIDLAKPVHLSFSTLLGIDQVDVSAHAAAGLNAIGKAIGASPLGIDESLSLEYYKSYQLKVDSSGVQSGNFGILALSGPGAKTYEENLRYGYQEELKIGDIIDTQTGNIAGSTREAIQERVNGCTQPPGDFSLRNCSRIILIPIYKPYQFDTNQLKQVKITGFAYFYITDPMDAKDTSITGVFIKRAGLGTFVDGAIDRGAYSIRLTE